MNDHRNLTQTAVMEVAERREASRHMFICPAEIIETGGGAQIAARTADLSMSGCYIDTLNLFAAGTSVRLCLTKDDCTIDLRGRVASSHAGLGMGLVFEDVLPEQAAALEFWLNPSDDDADAAFYKAASRDLKPGGDPNSNARFAKRLLKILERKGLLTYSEVAELRRDLES